MHFKIFVLFYLLYMIVKMPYTPKYKGFVPKGNEVNNKIMDEMKKKRATIVSSVQFRNDLLESRKILITRMSLIYYKVLRNYRG